ncbi:cytochrome c-type biogenesis protein CcmH [Aestuariibacter halophilus]|uniref:Cytochrome c-type biogenesis protein n=1 Tax=Fluctibacter halophilus TaxID=226011 RepID=A0ABS8G3W6_9ALTE|nr:cytochrome c-type biogenesis protein [Aestuariibacter halophilus]MCC2614796.1 cytochrome c-type biogenesis protein CcmH [Aestuariibacter halophilus]
MQRVIVMALLLFSLCAVASEEIYEFDDPAREALFKELTLELRCPQCQNQNIADSNAMIARDLRRKVYQLLQQGKSREEVIDYMKARYGDFVSYEPPVTPATIWLWVLPVGFVILAGWVIARSRPTARVDDEDKLAKANAMLENDE